MEIVALSDGAKLNEFVLEEEQLGVYLLKPAILLLFVSLDLGKHRLYGIFLCLGHAKISRPLLTKGSRQLRSLLLHLNSLSLLAHLILLLLCLIN